MTSKKIKFFTICSLVLAIAIYYNISWQIEHNKYESQITQIESHILIGVSIENVKSYLARNLIPYSLVDRDDKSDWIGNDDFQKKIFFSVHAPSQILGFLDHRVVVTVTFDDKLLVNNIVFKDTYSSV